MKALIELYAKPGYKEVNFDISNLVGTLTKYLFVLEGNSLSISGYYYDTDTETIKSLTKVVPDDATPAIVLHDLDSIAAIEIFDRAFNPLIDSGCYFSNAREAQTQGGFFPEFSDGDNLSEIVILNQSGSSGFDGTDPAHREKYFNGNATIDFTSSFWPYTDPVAWYRFGNGNQQVSTVGTIFAVGDIVEDDSGNNLDLDIVPNVSSLCVDVPESNYENIRFWRVDGPIRETQQPLGYHTSSVGGAYLLCATSSAKNDADEISPGIL